MKKIFLIALLILGLSVSYGFAQMGGHMGSGMMGQGYDDDDKYEYSYGMNPGMMGYGGYGMMGRGMMGGHMGGYGMMGGHMGGMMGRGMMGGYGMMGPGHMGGMMGSGMMGGYGFRGYDAEEYKEYRKEYQEYMNDTVDLRRKLHNKRFDYYEALRNPDTTRKSLLNIEKEMRDMQWKLYEKAPR